MRVVYEATRNYYPYLLPSIRSLLDHNNPEVVYVLAEDDKITGLPDVCQIINVSKQTWIRGSSPNYHNYYSWMVLMRVCLPALLPCDKVLQLDVDTIICDNLQPLWDTELDGKWFAAVQEYESMYRPYGDRYYNAGVMLLNLDQMRADNAMQIFVDELNTRRYRFPEQDLLNLYGVPDKVVDIPVRYNESFCCGYTDDPAVIHFAGYRDWYGNLALFRSEYMFRYL